LETAGVLVEENEEMTVLYVLQHLCQEVFTIFALKNQGLLTVTFSGRWLQPSWPNS